ncbi:MAG: hypothetical protein JW798_14310 [Prolixibacteraceae bacterium]|nr:hypothetical protein [Prolixibacteraceae bacterium]
MDNFKDQFEVIRPYNDEEVNPAIQRVIANPLFKGVVNYLYEGENYEEVIERFRHINTVDGFQKAFSDHAVKRTLEKTANGLTTTGADKLDTSKGFLFVSNHRDIVLDSAIMQILLLQNGHHTSQITFGSNLMSSEFIIDLGKLNKMFTLYRGGSRIEQYQNAMLHSVYIKHTIKNKNESIWIAQRDGRTKNGDDQTQTGLLKMFSLGNKDICEALAELNIVPLTVSYEYEPCDVFKVKEAYFSESGKYVKAPNEDFESVMYGITMFKGKIHMAFGTPLNEFIRNLSKTPVDQNEKALLIAQEIDRQIHLNYKLNGVNYIAYDLLNASNNYLNIQYSLDEIIQFENYIAQKLLMIDGDKAKLRDYFIKMYANPVTNYLSKK